MNGNMNADGLFAHVHEMFDVIASAIRKEVTRIGYWEAKDIEGELAFWFKKYLEKKLGMSMPVLVHIYSPQKDRIDHRFFMMVEVLVDIPVTYGDCLSLEGNILGFRMTQEDVQMILLQKEPSYVHQNGKVIKGDAIVQNCYPFGHEFQKKTFIAITKKAWEYNEVIGSYDMPQRFWDIGIAGIETNIIVQLAFLQDNNQNTAEVFDREKRLQLQVVYKKDGKEDVLLHTVLEEVFYRSNIG